MNLDKNIKPILIESNYKNYISCILNNCNNYRSNNYNIIYNIIIFLLFLFVFTIGLYISYKYKMSPEQNKIRKHKEQEFILNKIRIYQEELKKNNEYKEQITNLPNI